MAAEVLVVGPVEVDTDGVLALGSPSAWSCPGCAPCADFLVEIDLGEKKIFISCLLSRLQSTYPATPKPTIGTEVGNRSRGVVVGIGVVEIISGAISKTSKTGQLDLETVLGVA